MNLLFKCLLTVLFLGSGLSAYALKGDTDQPINITSGNHSLDMTNNIVTFSDNVVITQGSIKVTADKVTITRQEGQKETIEANGSPVTFQQTLDNGKPVNGKGNNVYYDLNSEFLILIGNAELKQQGSFIKASRITYDVKKQQLRASSGGNSRVRTVLIPNELQSNKK